MSILVHSKTGESILTSPLVKIALRGTDILSRGCSTAASICRLGSAAALSLARAILVRVEVDVQITLGIGDEDL